MPGVKNGHRVANEWADSKLEDKEEECLRLKVKHQMR